MKLIVRPSSARVVVLVFVLVLALYCAADAVRYRSDFANWDWLLHSGLAALALGLAFAYTVPERLEATLARLVNRRVILIDAETRESLWEELSRKEARWVSRGAVVVGVCILVGWILAHKATVLLPQRALLMGIEVVAGFVAGAHLGRMGAYGTLGTLLAKADIAVKPAPGHPDGGAGLKPLGDFYLFQAALVAIPAVYLSLWLILIQYGNPQWVKDYHRWFHWYFVLLAVSILFGVLAFIAPMWAFHKSMAREKRALLTEVDKDTATFRTLRATLSASETATERGEVKARLDALAQAYWDVEQMPTWPVDAKTRRRFAAKNLGLFLIPLLSDVLDVPARWQNLLSSITRS